ncbi:hypothetical protein [Mucilaginibacter paludis]|uniref:hypothetical protein n=1 Tax=Mucilaginibacter paludis TaxID=423351 RepID=UPI0002555ACC|nr:hypothetical protein [Mucilaginibacter paludis]
MQIIKNYHQQITQKGVLVIERINLVSITEKICCDEKCRYPQLALRILIHVMAGMDTEGKIYISARRLAHVLGAHYDTVTKCIKYLREIEVLQKEVC